MSTSAEVVMFSNAKSVFFLGSLITITILFVTSVWAVVDISEIPLDTQTKAAPANIMFILDDSGSMDWEIMTDEPSGLFTGDYSSGTQYPYEYVFDNPGDNAYSSWSTYGTILTNSARKMWKSQWFRYNKMYYDPSVTYEHWPTLPDADPDKPRSHPYKAGNTFDLSGSYLDVILKAGTFTIPRSHYYVLSKSSKTPYLVTINKSDSSVKYYSTTVTGSGYMEAVSTYTYVAKPPSDIKSSRTYAEERQNFANWYSFYRRRELTATAAVSNVISQMAGVQIGISTIHDRINQEVMRIKVGIVDKTTDLLDILYDDYNSVDGTPLRLGLQDVGQYYHRNDSTQGGIGSCKDNNFFDPSTPTVNSTCPYWTAANGGECQQAFAILMTDGYYNGNSPGVGDVDLNNGAPFSDRTTPSIKDTLADVAMYYWENDLSSGLKDLIPSSAVDPATYQHMVTYGVSFGVTGTLDPATHDPMTTAWTNPEPESSSKNNLQKIDDLYHASVNGHGVFLSAANPKELVTSLLAIMQNIKQRIGSASSVSVNGDELYKRIDNNTYMFQSSYNTSGWLGDVNSYKVDPLTGAVDLTNPKWAGSTANTGAQGIWAKYPWGGTCAATSTCYWQTRPIATYSGSAGIPFRFSDLVTSGQASLLGSTAAVQAAVLDYVRGDGSNTAYRSRTSRLGDIVHSSPIYHDGLIYVGANDGMMHAIIAEGTNAGKEYFSYVPSQVIKRLSLLADPAYNHRYYVDLTVAIKENVDLTPTVTTDANKTILVGGLGQGGKGYYALDISNLTTYDTTTKLWSASAMTEATAAGKVLWEFPHAGTSPTNKADVDDIGYSFSEPVIVKTNDPSHPWVVIFGNGYNSVDGQAVLFILDPANGNVLKKFELGSKSNNGLSTPSVTDVNGDGKADYVYAGDLSGNMWKIDLTGKLTGTAPPGTNWTVAFSANTPLFTAKGPSGSIQPITSKPDVMYHPQYHGYLVVFGTGKFLGTSDFLDKSVQTVYGIWDYGDDSDDSENLGTFDRTTEQVSTLTSTSTLLKQELLVPDFTYTDPKGHKETVRVLTDNAINWVIEKDGTSGEFPNLSTKTPNNAGWYFDLPNSGEKVVSRMMIRDDKAIFISFTPKNSPCTPGGNSILHEVDAADGSRLNSATFNTNGDNYINSSDTIKVTVAGKVIDVFVTGIQRQGHLQTPAILKLPGGKQEIKYMSSTSGSIETVKEVAAKTGLSSWREF